MTRQYEMMFIVDPLLSSDELKATADLYVSQLKNEGCEIVHIDELGLRQLAYPIKKRSNGVYTVVEFTTPTGAIVEKLEVAFRRDERVLRFLILGLDKFGIKFNQDKRAGLIGKRKQQQEAVVAEIQAEISAEAETAGTEA